MATEQTIKAGCKAIARGLRDFGYPDVTQAMIEAIHAKWKRGEDQRSNVIAMFATKEFDDSPELFGLSLPNQVCDLIAGAEAAGVTIDDGNVVDLIADNTDASLDDIRLALAAAGLAERFPRATAV